MLTESTTDLFRRRARAEAARYGSDPWVFVRELLQNARDAGARRIEIEVSRRGEHERVSCRDDGCGMSYEHARRYLFALYASSKEGSREQAGKFGIGFWSVLRFEPSAVLVRSRAARGDAWQVSLDGGLETVEVAAADLAAGTEIVLERPARDGCDLAGEVLAAARRFGRFLTRRDRPETPLAVTVDGRSANAELKLEAPCATFRGKGFRGAVGLGEVPEVELFAQGLFVRSASSLQELQAAGELAEEEATTEEVLAELPSLAPKVLIDSARLDLLLARSDARHDKHMRGVLRVAEQQLGRLITRQLQALKPQPFYRLWLGALRDRLEPYLGRQLAAAGIAGLILGTLLMWWPQLGGLARTGAGPPAAASPAVAAMDGGGLAAPGLDAAGVGAGAGEDALVIAAGVAASSARAVWIAHSYSDLAGAYEGPRPGALATDPSPLAMVYQPAAAAPYFTALVIEELTGSRWTASPASGELPRYEGAACSRDCLEVRLAVAGGQETLRLPVTTGHRLDASTVRLDGRPQTVLETASGEAVLRPDNPAAGELLYRTGPAPWPRPAQTAPRPAIDAPAELVSVADELRGLPVAMRVQEALDWVAERVRYDRSPGRLDHSAGATSFVETALAVGAGDCDEQSGVLATLLRLAGVEARLALGYVGDGGTIAPGLHAWVEVLGPDGAWSIADASVTSEAPGSAPPARRPPAGGPSAVRFPSRSEVVPWLRPEEPPLSAELFGPTPPGYQSVAIGDPGSPMGNRLLAPAALAVVLLLAGGAWTLRRRGAAGAVELSEGEDLAALLGGALRHPEAFARLPAMFHGRFVPLLDRRGGRPGGGRTEYISLARARRLGRKDRLFRSSAGSPLALRAAARGVPVIDASTAEGRVLSLALGAIDVDHWSNLFERSSTSEMSRRVNRRLEELGAGWRLREAAGLSRPWVEIALEDLGLGTRQIVVDPSHLEFRPVRALLPSAPEAAAFTLLDVLLHRVELPASERARVLAGFARAAVAEASDRTVAEAAGEAER